MWLTVCARILNFFLAIAPLISSFRPIKMSKTWRRREKPQQSLPQVREETPEQTILLLLPWVCLTTHVGVTESYSPTCCCGWEKHHPPTMLLKDKTRCSATSDLTNYAWWDKQQFSFSLSLSLPPPYSLQFPFLSSTHVLLEGVKLASSPGSHIFRHPTFLFLLW